MDEKISATYWYELSCPGSKRIYRVRQNALTEGIK